MQNIDAITRCDRSDHDHGSLEEARQCWRDEQELTVREVTLDEAKSLPGLIGRIAFAMLANQGWYSCKLDDRKTLFVLK